MKNELNQTTTNDIKTPTHIHHHQATDTGPLIIKIAAAVLLIILSWPAGIFILEKAGSKSPDKTLANGIIIIVVLIIFILAINHALTDKLYQYLDFKKEMAEKDIERLRYMQLMQISAVTDSRQLNPQRQKLIKCCIAVMAQAYDYNATHKKPFTGPRRPWSRRQASIIIIDGQPAGTVGELVRPFLEQNHVIRNNQINLKQFPNLASVQQLFYTPPIVNSANQLPTNINWSAIEQ
jgi:hypothetical protein